MVYAVVSFAKLAMIKKVAIIGSGPCGLSLAASLKRLDAKVDEIHIFESRDSVLQPNLGGGLQISGGAKMLEKIGLLNELFALSLPMKGVFGRNVANSTLVKIDIDNTVRNSGNKDLLSENENIPLYRSIMRDALQSLLYTSITKPFEKVKTKIIFNTNKELIDITERKTLNKIDLQFKDGTRYNDYDMVFGTDGIRSKTKEYIAKDNYDFIDKILALNQPIETRYTGIRLAIIPSIIDNNYQLRTKNDSNYFHQWLGNGCYTLIASYGGLKGIQHVLAIVYRDKINQSPGRNWLTTDVVDDSLPKATSKSIAVSSSSALKSKSQTQTLPKETFSLKQMIELKLQKSGLSKINDIMKIFNRTNDNNIIELGIRDLFIPLRHWSSKSKRILLLGDSCHPMAPFLGQGANQALQDSYYIANKILQYNNNANTETNDQTNDINSLEKIINSYESTRKLFVFRISVTAYIIGFMETLDGPIGLLIRDNFFRLITLTGFGAQSLIDLGKPRI